MDPRLKAILQKSQQIDNAAKKYDSVDSTVLEGRVNNRSSSGGGSLYDQIGGGDTSPQPVNALSEEYQDRVSSSGLPPEIQKAMRENPIPQGSIGGTGDFSLTDIEDLNPSRAYSEQDELETISEDRRPKKRVTNETTTPVSDTDIQKVVAQEVAKILPKVLENYFDKKIIKENTRLMKVLLKSTQDKKRV